VHKTAAYNNAGSEPEPQLSASELSASEPAESEPMLYCPVCSMKLDTRKCKLFCQQCGYYMSCADYY
jgi:hypothetical protein